MIAIPLLGQPHHAAEHHAASTSTSISTQVLGLSWDILGFLLLVYDAVTTFLQFFGLPPYHAREACDRCPRVFWTLEILVACLTGILLDHGDEEVKGRQALRARLVLLQRHCRRMRLARVCRRQPGEPERRRIGTLILIYIYS